MNESSYFWFVGSLHNGNEDQINRFIKEGIWQNGYQDKYLDLVRSIQPGDKIAIKAYCARNLFYYVNKLKYRHQIKHPYSNMTQNSRNESKNKKAPKA